MMSWLDNLTSIATGGLSSVLGYNSKKISDPLNLFTESSSEKLANQQYELEKANAERNYTEQVRQFNKNYRMQLEAYTYQKELNALQMEREDTAVQRRVADLEAAGISPTLAAGSAASATPVHAGNAPQHGVPQISNPSDIRVQQAMFAEGLMKDRMALAASLMGNIADVSRTKAETELIKAETNSKDIMNKYYDDYLSGRNLGQTFDNDMKALSLQFQQDTYSDRKYQIKQDIDYVASKIDVNNVEKQLKKNQSAYTVYQSALAQLQKQKLGIDISYTATKAMAEAYTYQWFSSRNLPIGNVSDHALLLALFAAGQHQYGSMPMADDGKPVIGNIPIRDGHGTTLPSGRKSYGIADVIDAVKRGLNFLNSPSFVQ